MNKLKRLQVKHSQARTHSTEVRNYVYVVESEELRGVGVLEIVSQVAVVSSTKHARCCLVL